MRLTPFKTLPRAPNSCQVQIVTSHCPKERWRFWHHLFQGNIHTHFRLIPREGFSRAHPESELKDGGVHSVGFGAKWADVAKQQPLQTIPGLFFNTDSTEFFKEDLLITTLEGITDEKMLHLVETIKKHARNPHYFNIMTHNCCSEAMEILKEAGVIDLSEMRADTFFYKALVPKCVRSKVTALKGMPQKSSLKNGSLFSAIFPFTPFTLLFSPLILAFGAWRTKEEEGEKGALKPVISKISDIFDPDIFQVNMTMKVSKWQKKQPNTVHLSQ